MVFAGNHKIKTKSNVIANYIGQGWTAIMGLAFVPIYIKLLGIEAYGLIGFYLMMQACVVLLDMGMTPVLSRETARFLVGGVDIGYVRNLIRSFEWISAVLTFTITLFFSLLSPWIAESWIKHENIEIQTIKHALIVMSFLVMLNLVQGLYRGILVGLEHQVTLNCINAISASVKWGGAVMALLWIKPTIEIFFMWQIFTSIITLIVLITIVYRILPPYILPVGFSKEALKLVSTFLGGAFMIAVLSVAISQVDKLVLSKLLTLSEYGYYTLAASASGAYFMLVNPITQALYPRLCMYKDINNEGKLNSLFHNGSQLITVIGGAVALTLFSCSKDIIFLWSNDLKLAEEVSPTFKLLIIGNFINGLIWLPYQLQLAFGLLRLTIIINVLGLIFMICGVIVGGAYYGVNGAAISWIIYNLLYFLIGANLMINGTIKKEKYKWYINDIAYPFLSMLIGTLILNILIPIVNLPEMLIIILIGFTNLIIGLYSAKTINAIRNDKF